MALQNILGLLFPLGAAIAIGALAIGLFYRDRTRELRHDDPDDNFISDFHPEPGFDTRPSSNSTRDEDEKCCICLDSMKRFQSVKMLPCAHRYHKRCVDNWLRYEMFCPSCRTVVPS